MINNIIFIALALAGAVGLFGSLYLWFVVAEHRFHGAADDLPIRTASLPDRAYGGLVGDRLRQARAERV
jgi:hypothetical protein